MNCEIFYWVVSASFYRLSTELHGIQASEETLFVIFYSITLRELANLKIFAK